MDPKEVRKKYAEIFGGEPSTFGIPDDAQGIYENMQKAIKTKQPLWTFYFDKDPNELEGVDL